MSGQSTTADLYFLRLRVADGEFLMRPEKCHLASVLAALVPYWTVNSDLKSIIIISPPNMSDDGLLALSIYAEKAAFSLEELYEDTERRLTTYDTWDAVFRAVLVRLIPFMTWRPVLH